MKVPCRIIAVSTLALTLTGGLAFAAQDHADNHQQTHYVRHSEWHKGAKISHDDWQRGAQVDWHAHHLRQPPRGYEWREVDGNYVLAAIATGVIASVIIASSTH